MSAQKDGAFQILVGKLNDVVQYAVGDPMRYLANWGRLYSFWPVHLETACCTPPDTLILGDNKPISSYQRGDKVVGATGHVDVTQTFSRDFDGDLLQICGRGMLPFRVTPEHPILTVQRDMRGGKGTYSDEQVWKRAADLVHSPTVKQSGRFLYPTGQHDCLLIPRISGTLDLTVIKLDDYATERGLNIAKGRGEDPPLEFPLNLDTAWLLGVYTAEGWTTEGHDVFFALGHDEEPLVRRITKIVESLGYSPHVKERETGVNLRFSSAILARALRRWCGHLAENKKMPDFVLYHRDIDILKAFISGYFEGDGSEIVDSRGPIYVRAETTSRVLALQIQLAYARLGLFARISLGHRGGRSEIIGRLVNVSDSYEIWSMSSKRKCFGFDVQSGFIAVPIRSISNVRYSGTGKQSGDRRQYISRLERCRSQLLGGGRRCGWLEVRHGEIRRPRSFRFPPSL